VPRPQPAAPLIVRHRYLIMATRPFAAAPLVFVAGTCSWCPSRCPWRRPLCVTGTWLLWPRCAPQVLYRGAQTDARNAAQVIYRGGQAVIRGAARCALQILYCGAQADARGAAQVIYSSAQAVARGAARYCGFCRRSLIVVPRPLPATLLVVRRRNFVVVSKRYIVGPKDFYKYIVGSLATQKFIVPQMPCVFWNWARVYPHTGFVGSLFFISPRTGHGSSQVFEILPAFSCILRASAFRAGGDASIFFQWALRGRGWNICGYPGGLALLESHCASTPW
jgi:hypothetical protein